MGRRTAGADEATDGMKNSGNGGDFTSFGFKDPIPGCGCRLWDAGYGLNRCCGAPDGAVISQKVVGTGKKRSVG